MKIETVTITIGRTINLGNFQSIKIEAAASAVLADDDKMDEVRAALVAECMKGLTAAKASPASKL